MINHLAAQLAMRNRLLTVSGLPSAEAWELKRFTPTGAPYIADQFIPATSTLLTVPAQHGLIEETGIYVVQFFGLDGADLSTIRTPADAIVAVFAPETAIATTAGDVVRVRSNPGPFAGQILPMENGYAVCTIRVPWYAHSQNVIAA